MDQKKQYPVVEGLFTYPSEEPHLIGGRCKTCGTYFFPKFVTFHKVGCERGPVEEVLLSRRGELVSYTVQYYLAPPPFVNPDPFVPYGIGLVALPEGIQIPGILTGIRIEDIKMHIDVEIVLEKLFEDEEGKEAVTWKWRPVQN